MRLVRALSAVIVAAALAACPAPHDHKRHGDDHGDDPIAGDILVVVDVHVPDGADDERRAFIDDALPALRPPSCPVDRDPLVVVVPGEAPVVVVATHAGEAHPDGCAPGSDEVHAVGARTCTPELDACTSGPCRASGPDRFSRALTFALVDALAACLGRRPSLVLAETSRVHVDLNRDPADPAGPRCAYDDPAALPLWQDFHDAVAGLVVDADRVATATATRALLLDVHTHASLAAAPPPAVILGSGRPFGTTMPGRAADDPSFGVVFGDDGLRPRLLAALRPRVATVEVWPRTADGAVADLFNGRTVVHRYGLGLAENVPAIDVLQLEASDGAARTPTT